MGPIRLAVSIRCLGKPLKESLALAARFRADGVQLDARTDVKPGELSATGRRQFLHLLADSRLLVESLDFPTRGGLLDPDRLPRRVDAIKDAMELAAQLKSRIVTVRSGELPDAADAESYSQAQSVLNDLARHGNRIGVNLAVGAAPGAFTQLLSLLRGVSEGPIGVNFDPATIVAAGGSAVELLREAGTMVDHVVARDATRTLDGLVCEVVLGRGEAPWDEILATLDDMSYRGWLAVDRTQGDDPAGDAGRAILYLQALRRG